MKTSIFVVFVIAACLAVGAASAADFGGSCCADLEERIANLEVTAASKGDRKMSLTISGQVHRVVLWWDDGHSSGTFYGLDSTNASSRFFLLGNAKVSPKVTAGFEIVIELEAGGMTARANQFDEDGKINATICSTGCASFNEPNVDAYFADARRVAWWIEHADLGRLTIGRREMAGVPGTIDLTGHLFLVASGSFVLLNGTFFIRGPNGQYYAMVWGQLGDPASASGRSELVRYDSPSWHGFIYSASIAEAGDFWGTTLRYVGEHGGFRMAGRVGYERVTDIATPVSVDLTNAAFTGRRPDITAWGLALSAMHIPTGLFVQGYYNAVDYGGEIIGAASAVWGQTTVNKKDTNYWLIQAGISKNWFGYGRTSVYGEYGMANDAGADITNAAGTTVGRSFAFASFTGVSGVTSTEFSVWGVGIAQDFDAASATFYIGYRHFDVDIRCTDFVAAATCSGGVAVGAAAGTFTTHKLPTEGADVIVMGTRVRF